VPDAREALRREASGMVKETSAARRYLLHHRHRAEECGVAFASFKGLRSPLRHSGALASCRCGEHAIWWLVDAASPEEALELLPFFVAERSTAVEVTEVRIP
jgi:hypothetical protein